MGKVENKMMRRRLANAYLSSVISISLVLLLVGVASMLLVNAKSVSDYFKENMQVSVLMKQSVSEEKAMKFQEKLEKEKFIKSTLFVSKEQGRRELAEQLGEDFLDVFETSPIPVAIDVTLEADYVSRDSLEMVKAHIGKSDLVEEVVYQTSLVEALIERGLINSPADIYDLTLDRCVHRSSAFHLICADQQHRAPECLCKTFYHTYHEASRGHKVVHPRSVPGSGCFSGLVFILCGHCDACHHDVLHKK